MYSRQQTKSTPVQIPQKNQQYKTESEYSLKQNLFDPTKGSPPNQFMNKLKSRMILHDSLHQRSVVS
jgi:hypothetical protein